MKFSCFLIANMRRVKLGGVGKVFLKTRQFGAFLIQLLVVWFAQLLMCHYHKNCVCTCI